LGLFLTLSFHTQTTIKYVDLAKSSDSVLCCLTHLSCATCHCSYSYYSNGLLMGLGSALLHLISLINSGLTVIPKHSSEHLALLLKNYPGLPKHQSCMSYVHTTIGSLLPPFPRPLSFPPPLPSHPQPLASKQKLFCPYL
jgi:hypothetical protein